MLDDVRNISPSNGRCNVNHSRKMTSQNQNRSILRAVALPSTRMTVCLLLVTGTVFRFYSLPLVEGFTAKLAAPWIAQNINLENLKVLNDIYTVVGESDLKSSKSSSSSSHLDSEDTDEEDDAEEGETREDEDEAEEDEDVALEVSVLKEGQFPDASSTTASSEAYFAAAAAHHSSNGVVSMRNRPTSSPSVGTKRPAVFNSEMVAPTVQSCLGSLLKMTRPGNFPGVVLFHIAGIHRSLSSLGNPTSLAKTVFKPSMFTTLIALLLTSATSMLVNDYYDARSGVDSLKAKNQPSIRASSLGNRNVPSTSYLSDRTANTRRTFSQESKPLVTGAVPFPIAKRFLSYLYAALLLSITFIPGTPARLSVVIGTMLTFWYTQHLKPKTWLKNVTCASLMALSPLTSGAAALHLLTKDSITMTFLQSIGTVASALGPLVLTLFFGFMGRELMMDITDRDSDKLAGVITVPVQYGKRRASQFVLGFMSAMGVLAVGGPLAQLLGTDWNALFAGAGGNGILSLVKVVLSTTASKKFLLSAMGSIWMIVRAYQVNVTEGGDDQLIDRAVEEGKQAVLLILASSFL